MLDLIIRGRLVVTPEGVAEMEIGVGPCAKDWYDKFPVHRGNVSDILDADSRDVRF